MSPLATLALRFVIARYVVSYLAAATVAASTEHELDLAPAVLLGIACGVAAFRLFPVRQLALRHPRHARPRLG